MTNNARDNLSRIIDNLYIDVILKHIYRFFEDVFLLNNIKTISLIIIPIISLFFSGLLKQK